MISSCLPCDCLSVMQCICDCFLILPEYVYPSEFGRDEVLFVPFKSVEVFTLAVFFFKFVLAAAGGVGAACLLVCALGERVLRSSEIGVLIESHH